MMIAWKIQSAMYPSADYTLGTGQPYKASVSSILRVRFHIIRNARIENVGKSQSCMVSKLRIIWKQTVSPQPAGNDAYSSRIPCSSPPERKIPPRTHGLPPTKSIALLPASHTTRRPPHRLLGGAEITVARTSREGSNNAVLCCRRFPLASMASLSPPRSFVAAMEPHSMAVARVW